MADIDLSMPPTDFPDAKSGGVDLSLPPENDQVAQMAAQYDKQGIPVDFQVSPSGEVTQRDVGAGLPSSSIPNVQPSEVDLSMPGEQPQPQQPAMAGPSEVDLSLPQEQPQQAQPQEPQEPLTIGNQVLGAAMGAANYLKIPGILANIGSVLGGVASIQDIAAYSLKNLVTKGELGPGQEGWDMVNVQLEKWSKWNNTNWLSQAGIDDKAMSKNQTYNDVMAPFHWLGEVTNQFGNWVLDKTGSPGLAIQAEMAGQIAAIVVGGKAVEVAAGVKAVSAQQRAFVREAYSQNFVDHVTDALDKIDPGVTRSKEVIPQGVTPKEHFENMVGDERPIPDILQFIADNPDVADDAALQKVAGNYANLASILGLDNIQHVSDPLQLVLNRWGGAYSSVQDALISGPGMTGPEAFIHEIGHAITLNAIKMWEDVSAGRAMRDVPGSKFAGTQERLTLDNMSPAQLEVYNRVKDLNTVFELAADKITKDHRVPLDIIKDHYSIGRDMTEDEFNQKYAGIKVPKALKDELGDLYGISNLREFATEIMANPRFRQILARYPVKPGELNLPAKSVTPFRTMWDAAKSSIKAVLMPGTGYHDTLLSYAFDHTTGLIDHMTPDIRGYSMDNIFDPQGGKGAKTRQAETIKRFDDLANAQDAISKSLVKTTLYRVSNLLKEGRSPDEVLTRIRGLNLSDAFQRFVDEHGERMINLAPQIVRAYGRGSFLADLSPAERLLAANHLGVEDFMREHMAIAKAAYEEAGIPWNDKDPKIMTKDDLFDEATWVLPETQIKMTKGQGGSKGANLLGGLVAKFFLEKAAEYRSLKAQLFYKSMDLSRGYSELSASDKKAAMQTAIYWDSQAGRSTLRTMGLQWPTRAMLEQRHPKVGANVLDAYEGITRAMDYNMKLINQALIKEGKEPIQPVPGMMPHFWEGAYRVLVDRVERDAQGNVTSKKLVWVKGFQTRYGAMKFVDELNSGKRDGAGFQLRPQVDMQSGDPFSLKQSSHVQGSMTQLLSDTSEAYRNLNGLEPSFIEKIEKMEADAIRGDTKHILERNEIGGFRGDLVNDLGFNEGILASLGIDAYNNRILKNFEVYFKNISEFYGNTMFTNEVFTRLYDHQPIDQTKPFYGKYLDNAKMLKEYMAEYTSNFTGENYNHISRFADDEAKAWLKKAGLDPELARRSMNAARNFLSLSKLRGNIGFYVGNFVQPLHTLSMMVWANEMLRQSGAKIDYALPFKAFYRAIENRNDPALQEALQWASDNHIIDDAMLEYQMRAKAPSTIMNWVHTATGGKINPAIEMMARSFSFAVAHEFFREVYKGDVEKTRTAAQNIMEMVNVNYDRSSRPIMYQNFGMLGEAMSPFAVYRNAYIGNNWLMFRAIKSGKFDPRSFLPLLTFQMVYLATAGASGVAMTDEWDQLAKIWNHFNPESALPDSTQAFMRFQRMIGAPDSFTFGAISTATKAIPGLEHGLNLGASMTASSLDSGLGTALNPFLYALASLVGVGVKTLGHIIAPDTFDPMSLGRAWGDLEQLAPAYIKGPVERAMISNEQVGFKSTEPEGYVKRERPDWNALMWTGKISLQEYKERMEERSVTNLEKFRTQSLKNLVMAATDAVDGKTSQVTFGQALQRATVELQVNPDEFTKMVMDEYMKRNTTIATREVSGGKEMSATERAKIQLRRELGRYDEAPK